MEKKNKFFVFMLVVVLVLGVFALTACEPEVTEPEEPDVDEPDVDEPEEVDEPEVTRLNLGSGWVTAVYYPLGGAMSRIAHNEMDNISLTVESSGASAVNVKMIGSGDLDLAIVQNDVAYDAFYGVWREDFVANPIPNMRGMFTLHAEPVQLVAAADAGIETPADLAGKRVALGPIGSGAEINALQVLEAAGLTEDDLASAERLEAGESADFLRDGRIDAAFYTTGIGAAVIDELALMTDVVLVNIEGAITEQLMEEYPFYATVTIPADTYQNVPEANTVTVLAMVICREDISEDLIYDFISGIFDNIQTIHDAHPAGQMVTLETALDGMSIPLHPGAIKFFEEKGMQ